MNLVLQILKEHKADLMARYPIKSLALFGSYSRGDNTIDSDVDVMVELSEPVDILFIQLAHELEDILHKKVDLVSTKGIKPDYYQYIKKDIQYV